MPSYIKPLIPDWVWWALLLLGFVVLLSFAVWCFANAAASCNGRLLCTDWGCVCLKKGVVVE